MPHTAVGAGRFRPRRTFAYVLGLGLIGLATPASAQTGSAPTGGALPGPTPKIRAVQCRTLCASLTAGRPGSRVRVTGRALANVQSVVFQGAPGGADDVSVAPLRTRRTSLEARVPRTAVSGPVTVVSADGAESAPTSVPLALDLAPAVGGTNAGDTRAVDVEIQGNRVFYGAERQAQLSYFVRDAQPVKVTIELVRTTDGVAIARWEPGAIPPNTPQTVTWDGTAGGRVQRDGRYEFRVAALLQSGAVASSSQAAPGGAPSPGSFLFLGHQFPIRSAHEFGTGAAAFGGGRNHQGQDVFAKCGSPLVAARGGVVKFNQYHSAAGHYIVVDGEQTGDDYAYMHLRDAALVKKGDHIYTGQPIGFIGDTGHAHGCHLHFEMWKAPGWYSGGSAFDPLPQLRAWDAQS